MTISPLSLFGFIESSNLNPQTATDLQQGSLFQQQYGSGVSGFNNWLSQSITNNPNLTLGDAYAQYNAGTGTPGSGPTWAQLATLNPPAYQNASNKFGAFGLSPTTLISSLTAGATGSGPPTDITGAQYDQYGNPLTAGQAAMGATGSAGNTGWLYSIFDTLSSFLGRGAMMLIGGLLIAGAIFALAMQHSSTLRNAAQSAVKVAP